MRPLSNARPPPAGGYGGSSSGSAKVNGVYTICGIFSSLTFAKLINLLAFL